MMKRVLVVVLGLLVGNAWGVDTSGITLLTGVAGADYGLGVPHQPEGSPSGYSSGLFFDFVAASRLSGALRARDAATLTFTTMTADEGIDAYLMSAGTELSTATLTGRSMLVGVTPTGYRNFGVTYALPNFGTTLTSTSAIFNTSGTFYLGLVTGRGFESGGTGLPNRNVFGWAKFSFDATGITLLSSAVTYDQGGIIVGTDITIPVPELDQYAMLLAGLVIVAGMSRRRDRGDRLRSINALQ
jgi:hypothetical protein